MNYLEVPLAADVERSEAEGGMVPLWEAAAASIDEGLQAGGVVMVMVHGRSRSASFIVWWLHRRLGVPVRAAASFLRDASPLIDWSLVAADQLVKGHGPMSIE